MTIAEKKETAEYFTFLFTTSFCFVRFRHIRWVFKDDLQFIKMIWSLNGHKSLAKASTRLEHVVCVCAPWKNDLKLINHVGTTKLSN